MYSRFVEYSKEALASIDPATVANLTIGQHVADGGLYTFSDLAELDLGSLGKEYVGLKMARVESAGVDGRFITEMAIIALLADSSTELRGALPSFMGLLTSEDYRHQAILTEDASQGGRLPVIPKRLSRNTEEQIYLPFSDYGDKESVLDEETMTYRMAFSVNDTERLLDLAPSPIKAGAMDNTEIGRGYFDAVIDAEPDLTITIPSDSVLARAIGSRTLRKYI